jgi:SAM-dependent methyltransferase
VIDAIGLLPYSPFGGVVFHVLNECHSILDIGCGRGGIARVIRARTRTGPCFLVGIDLFLEYLVKARDLYDDVLLCDARHLPIRSKVFDAVVAKELIEHLEKKQGHAMLPELENIARRQVVLTTPVGFACVSPMGDPAEIELQQHRSGWFPGEFTKLGYEVKGVGGCRCLPRDFACWLSAFFPITWSLPQASHGMICFKATRPTKL